MIDMKPKMNVDCYKCGNEGWRIIDFNKADPQEIYCEKCGKHISTVGTCSQNPMDWV